MIYVYSIGLNVGGSEPRGQLGASLRIAEALAERLVAVAMTRGEWEGIPERTLQVALEVDGPLRANDIAVNLMRALHQECVAYIRPGALRWSMAPGMDDGGSIAEYPIVVDLRGA